MLKRYWINQPSTLQDDHKYHGLNVLADPKPGETVTDVYPATGDIVSMRMHVAALSTGWRPTSTER